MRGRVYCHVMPPVPLSHSGGRVHGRPVMVWWRDTVPPPAAIAHLLTLSGSGGEGGVTREFSLGTRRSQQNDAGREGGGGALFGDICIQLRWSAPLIIIKLSRVDAPLLLTPQTT